MRAKRGGKMELWRWIDNKKAYDIVLQSRKKEYSKYSTNFIMEVMKNWRVDMTAGWKTFADKKIQRGIFQEDAPSSMNPLNHILRKCTGVYKFATSIENIKP